MSESIYILGHSQTEIRRLINQATILRPTTERLLRSAGIEQGMRVLDVGCGAGVETRSETLPVVCTLYVRRIFYHGFATPSPSLANVGTHSDSRLR